MIYNNNGTVRMGGKYYNIIRILKITNLKSQYQAKEITLDAMNNNENAVDQFELRYSILKDGGVSDESIKIIKKSIEIQMRFLPINSLLYWLDGEIKKRRPGSKNYSRRSD